MEEAMDITKLSVNGLLMMYGAVRDALSVDDNATGPKPYGVRDTPDWREWSDGLERELEKRNARFVKIDWS
jgi:hypothetical protein